MFVYSLLMMGITSSVFLLNLLYCYVVFRYESLHEVNCVHVNNIVLLQGSPLNCIGKCITNVDDAICLPLCWMYSYSLFFASLYSPLSIFC